MSAQLDAAIGDPYYATSVLSIPDQYDAAKMEPFNPAASAGMPWWQSLVSYGAVRAIDNRFGPQQVAGNTQAGSFAGANGRTYLQNGSAQGGLMESIGGIPGIVLAVAGIAAALYLFKD